MIFGKSKDELLKNTQSDVFDIMRVGANISKYRKASGMTQTELADRLGLSFQAVSNWERGQSCPDIANLMALAEMFGVSVDKLLGSERAAKLVEEIHEEKTPEMSAEEIKELAPILSDKHVDGIVIRNLADGSKHIDIQDIADVAPYVSEELLDETAEMTLQTKGIDEIPTNVLAFLSEDFIDEMAKKAYIKGGINAIPSRVMPFISEEVIEEMAKEVVDKNGIDALPSRILAFISEDTVDDMVKNAYDECGVYGIPTNLLPFASEDILNDIAREVIKKQGPEGLAPILAFIDSSIIEDYYRKKWTE